MAGGKETPRQKMIGMMYLVLTALLALNVSKSILDAFVAIEENIQISNENEFARGQEKYAALKEVSEDKSVLDVMKKAQKLMVTVKQIDAITAQRIKMIDDLKIEILKACGEDVTSVGTKESIIFKKYDANDPLKPTRMKLEHVQGMDKYDDPMRILIGEDIKKPKGKGMDLWKSYNAYRKELTELIAGSVIVEAGSPAFFFKAPEINEFNDMFDLSDKVEKAIKASRVAPDDQAELKKIYISLTKLEKSTVHDVKNVHWIGKTFDHSPVVAAIASLSSMQKEILTARADAVALVRGRVGGGEYSFNKIMPLAYGPDLANAGDEVTVEVLMAAYDSDKQPEVTYAGSKVTDVKDGKGFVKTKASGANEMVLKGEITIKNKSGAPKTMPWEKVIKIMKPQGTVSLPELAVLYRNYPNVVEGVASGFPESKLSGDGNVTLTKSGNQFIAKTVGMAKKATIFIAGYNAQTKKTVNLGKFEYDIKPIPKAEMYWGSAADGDKATNRSAKTIKVSFGEGIPLKGSFECTTWTLAISGVNKFFQGQGSMLSAEALQYLGAAKPGSTANFSCVYSGTGVRNKQTSASIKL
jgi:hypothetical protein